MSGRVVRPAYRQHTVSKVVLKRFTRSQKISVYDREREAIYCKGPQAALFHLDFDKFDPETSERRWEQDEAKMSDVYQLIDAHRVLDDPDAVENLRDLLALNWVRTPAIRQVHQRITREVTAQSMADLRGRPETLARILQQKTGLVAAGQSELDWINEGVHREILGDR